MNCLISLAAPERELGWWSYPSYVIEADWCLEPMWLTILPSYLKFPSYSNSNKWKLLLRTWQIECSFALCAAFTTWQPNKMSTIRIFGATSRVKWASGLFRSKCRNITVPKQLQQRLANFWTQSMRHIYYVYYFASVDNLLTNGGCAYWRYI